MRGKQAECNPSDLRFPSSCKMSRNLHHFVVLKVLEKFHSSISSTHLHPAPPCSPLDEYEIDLNANASLAPMSSLGVISI